MDPDRDPLVFSFKGECNVYRVYWYHMDADRWFLATKVMTRRAAAIEARHLKAQGLVVKIERSTTITPGEVMPLVWDIVQPKEK